MKQFLKDLPIRLKSDRKYQLGAVALAGCIMYLALAPQAPRRQICGTRSLKQQPAVKLKNLRSRTQFKKLTEAQKFGCCVYQTNPHRITRRWQIKPAKN